jgi:hypothetical protein
MGDTTLTIDTETRERLLGHRAIAHDSWDDVLNGMMDVLPTVDELSDGCTWCGDGPYSEAIEDGVGFIEFFTEELTDGEEFHHTGYFCSAECAVEAQEEAKKYVPENPEKVVVGGADEIRAAFAGATFYLDGQRMEVGLDVPGAFDGTDSHGGEYDYYGEPVYVYNEGDIVQRGVIEDIIHEDNHTALVLGHDHETVKEYEPEG